MEIDASKHGGCTCQLTVGGPSRLSRTIEVKSTIPGRFSAGADTLLGPEMKSTGEVMGIDTDFSNAYAKASIAAGLALPKSGKVFITMIDKFKEEIVPVAKQLQVWHSLM